MKCFTRNFANAGRCLGKPWKFKPNYNTELNLIRMTSYALSLGAFTERINCKHEKLFPSFTCKADNTTTDDINNTMNSPEISS